MSEYSKEFVKDVAKRTKENLKKYKGHYDTTQLLNSAVGLLIIPHANYYKKIENSFVSSKVLNIMRNAIQKNSYPEDKKPYELKDIVKHIRNGIAHSNLYFEAIDNELHTIQIKDHKNGYTKTNKKTGSSKKVPAADFEIILSISNLREFMIEFADAIISMDTIK